MTFQQALALVYELAEQNMLDPDDMLLRDAHLLEEAKEQENALEKVHSVAAAMFGETWRTDT